MVMQAHIDAQGAIQLPPELRRRLGWRDGTELVIEDIDHGLVLRSAASADADAPAIGEVGQTLAGRVLSREDFSSWDPPRD